LPLTSKHSSFFVSGEKSFHNIYTLIIKLDVLKVEPTFRVLLYPPGQGQTL
jgi:hypothetical protein